MKSCFLLFCTMAFSINASTGFSQNAKIVIDSDRSIAIEEIFRLIKSQTDYLFVYDVDMVKGTKPIQVKKGVVKIKHLLKMALEPISCTYEFERNTFIVKKKKTVKKANDQQETFTITGRVLDKAGIPIVGASVVVATPQPTERTYRNSNFIVRGTETDFDGSFSLEVSLNLELSAFALGFRDHVQLITTKQEQYTIVLKEELNELDEVVLTGYTETNIERSSVAASKITKKDIARQKAINLSDRLEGLSPGLNINSVNTPGGQQQTELIIRGISTFDTDFQVGSQNSGQKERQNSLNRQPLIVLDGFPYEGPLNDIDPQTIETIDILRDAAATTLWGIRASNGVVVITTKRGSEYAGKPTITFSNNLTIGTRQDLRDLGLASAEETIKIYSNSYELDNGLDNIAFNVFNDPSNPFNIGGRYQTLDPFQQIWADFYNPNGGISATERDTRLAALAQNDILKDFEKYLLSPGFIRENTLSVRGGDPLSSYNFTVTHANEERPDLGDKFRRLNLSLTTDFRINEKTKVVLDASLTSSVTKDNGIGVSSLLTGVGGLKIYDRLVDNNGEPQAIRNVYSEFRDEFKTLGFEDPSYNPILDQKLRDNENKRFNLRLAAGINYEITDWLTADIKYQYNRIINEINNNKDVRLFETRTNNNNYIDEVLSDENTDVVRNVPYGGTLENSYENTINSVLRGSLQFNNTYGEYHNLSALGGMEVSENTVDLSRRIYYGYNDRTGVSNVNFDPTSVEGYRFGSIPSYLQGSARIQANNIFRPDVVSRAVSTFGNIAYSYKSKYNLTLSGKIDQTTAFGINKRLSRPLLWAVGGSWNLAKENFIATDWINTLKLRGSYGVNGNLRRGLSTVVVIEYNFNEEFTQENYANISSAGNPNLTFEETTTKNLGLDFGFFDNMINGSIDVYERVSENLLVPFNINETFGQTGDIFRNDGAIENKGIEINLNFDILTNAELTWNSNFNFSFNKNKVLSFAENNEPVSTFLITDVNDGKQNIIGKDISSRYRFEWAGLDRDGNPQIFNENGDIIGYEEGLPSIAALVTTKPFIAPGFGGFRNSFGYKNFTLSFLASFKFGHVFQESLAQKYASTPDKVYHKDVSNAWKIPGDQLTTNIPALPRNADELSFAREEFFTLSNYGIQDASYVRLRDVTLGYTLNNLATEKIGLDVVNFTLQARNLGLLWRANNVGLDPESVPFTANGFSFTDNFAQAFRPGIIPPVTIVFGVNLNF
ncbi:SusC/RagA family TonB-linked outer membrane protein [Flavivirga abyssicola]|uniref:SusC/RagA family TonB-linked outer membrane protein n=1 Tax=Flavivirga abyssicola TaxID=3063533 RepID=UPI0026DFB8FA|nr:SusC/RagA family TonB-linked outer membrane protein [Flavivirga sp. MEBiC07777]WVK12633.1 SusC/RagA family TonB-linked outer membrane protein [Flavivirga sp. MEBiC07777]